jgi:hypothetical protein
MDGTLYAGELYAGESYAGESYVGAHNCAHLHMIRTLQPV